MVPYLSSQTEYSIKKAVTELGYQPRFDLRSFHDEMLNGGVLPLELLDSRTDAWIEAQKHRPAAVAAN